MPNPLSYKPKVSDQQKSEATLSARGAPPNEGFLIVAIGASAGGLEVCRKLLDALPAVTGMAFILVQHLDPTHESMMVDLLSNHTALAVLQAVDGMLIEREHFYIIPPATYLSVSGRFLHLSQPQARHGARLPFDFLLNSLAQDSGRRAVCVVLSGTGADGAEGLKALKTQGGFVIAQDPLEAPYDGMPRSAIVTGAVDRVLEVAEIPDALLMFDRKREKLFADDCSRAQHTTSDRFHDIIELLLTKTAHDFRLYKKGTLHRRIQRRMGLSGIEIDDTERYLTFLHENADELNLLAKDLLINVTSFFRDPKAFDFLAKKIVPELIQGRGADRPLRVWIAGCSTGEETYSLAMLFLEAISAAKSDIKLQLFASDIDTDAITSARQGVYPDTIEADVSPARLAHFFSKEEEHSYRISPQLRAAVVFTVHDVLVDPPFARIDMVSCRNLMIYLGQEAQTKVISIFHWALCEGGVLFLGGSETIGSDEREFQIISKSERLYRMVARGRSGKSSFPLGTGDATRIPPWRGPAVAIPRNTVAEICRRSVIEHFVPASVLINSRLECLYTLGKIDRYLHVASGQATNDILAMTLPGVRTKLRTAVLQASRGSVLVRIRGNKLSNNDLFVINVQPVQNDGEQFFLICFIDEPKQELRRSSHVAPEDVSRVAELELELAAARTELQSAIRSLEISSEEQTAIDEEALSVNEEFQSTNEELLTSKEELQSLNEELTALNSQLQETLERQRTTSNDLQNVLYSTDVATLFLDTDLNIRFFTPMTKLLFRIVPSDVGRPLADFSSLAEDSALLDDAKRILKNFQPLEKEIKAQDGAWYMRRMMPYRTHDNGVEGVVITFIDITERKEIAKALEAAKLSAERANAAKSRFLAAASHDLRQPLQTLVLLQGLLEKRIEEEATQKLAMLQGQTLGAMSGILDTLLDINEIDAGVVLPHMLNFSINDKFHRLLDEFAYHAQAKGLDLRVVHSSAIIESDRRLLEQMIRNLLSNAMKYTKQGRVLLGCRRRGGILSIEIWDTGIGIPEADLQTIFEEFQQIDNAARERSRGLGLGLSIVRRLGNLLGHQVRVRSQPGKGSVFSIDVKLASSTSSVLPEIHQKSIEDELVETRLNSAILVVEDDPQVRALLMLALTDAGHRAEAVADSLAALQAIERGAIRPDLILTDYNLPGALNGAQLTARIREKLHRQIPVIVLSGDISTSAIREINVQHCVQLNKPVKLKELIQEVERLLPGAQLAVSTRSGEPILPYSKPVIFIVDDDRHVREGIRLLLEADGRFVKDYATCESFLEAYRPGSEACLLIDAYLPGMNGLALLKTLHDAGHQLPSIMITGDSDISTAVQAMKAGAADFLEKPFSGSDLLASIDFALVRWRDSHKLSAWQEAAATQVEALTPRQHQIMDMVLAGHPSKNIAADLGISQRTVENHRASIMRKTGSTSLPALARLALAAAQKDEVKPFLDNGP